MDKKQREAQRHQEDVALNRGLIWVGIAILLEMLLVFLKGRYIEYGFVEAEVDLAIAIHGAFRVLRLACPVLVLVCLAVAVLRVKKSAAKNGLLVGAAIILGVVGLCAHVSMTYEAAGMQMLLVLVPALAGLALVYFLYQREFFLSALPCVLSVLGLWFVRYGAGFGLDTVLILVGIVLVLAVALWIKKQEGDVKLLGHTYHALPKDTNYNLILVSGLVALAAVAAAVVLSGTVAYYLIFVMIAWIFALLVYYTVKMM